MCRTMNELQETVSELREYKILKEELENQIKALEREVIGYMQLHSKDTETGNDFKVTYKMQSRTTLDKAALKDILGDDLQPFEKVNTFPVLRIK